MQDPRCKVRKCYRKVDYLVYEEQAKMCDEHFQLRMAWAIRSVKNPIAKKFLAKYSQTEECMVDENGREVPIADYIRKMRGL